MKKVLVVLALLVPLAAMVAVTVPARQVTEIINPFELDQTLAPEEIELKLDEATPLEWSLILDDGDRLAVKFTPPSYPFDITKAAYAPWDDQYDQEVKIIFYGDGADPGSTLGNKDVSAEAAQNFTWFDMSDLNISITSGSFYCAVELLTNTYPYFIYDAGAPLHHASWFYPTSAGQWYSWDNVNVIDEGDTIVLGEAADMMIRVKGEVTGIGEVELSPVPVELTPSATVIAAKGHLNYTIPSAGAVEISLWDAVGREIETLYTGHADAGEHTLAWDASNLARGTYFVRLKTSSDVKVAKVVLVD